MTKRKRYIYPQILKDWKTADYKRACSILSELHSIIKSGDMLSLLCSKDADNLRPELKQIADAFDEQIHWDRHGCTIGTYTG